MVSCFIVIRNRETAAGIGCAISISFNAGGNLVSRYVLLTTQRILVRIPGKCSPWTMLGMTDWKLFASVPHNAPLLRRSSFTWVTPNSSGREGSELTPRMGIWSSRNDAVLRTVPSPPTAITKSLSSRIPRWRSSRPISVQFVPVLFSNWTTFSTHLRCWS